MTQTDVYESLFEMYAQLPIGLHLAKDSMTDLMRLQFTPEEAQIALDVGFAGGKLAELSERTGITSDSLKIQPTEPSASAVPALSRPVVGATSGSPIQ
jgi:hypothetical protein